MKKTSFSDCSELVVWLADGTPFEGSVVYSASLAVDGSVCGFVSGTGVFPTHAVKSAAPNKRLSVRALFRFIMRFEKN